MRLLYIIILLFTPYLSLAQFTLQDAIDNASSIDQKDATTQAALQDLQIEIQNSKRYPFIYGEANVQRNLIIPVTPVPAIAFNPSASPDEMMAMRFATDWSAKAGINASFDLFNPQKRAALTDAKQQTYKAQLSTLEANTNLRNSVIELYAQVLLAQLQEQTATDQLNIFSKTLNIIKERYEAGRASQIELNHAMKKYAELLQQSKEAAYVVLNSQIELRKYVQFSFDDTFSTSFEEALATIQSTDSMEIQQLQLDMDYAALKLQNNKLNALPTLTLNAYYGTNYFNNELRLFNNNYWHGNSYINVSLRLPITENIEKNLNNRQLKLQYNLAQEKYNAFINDKVTKNKIQQNNISNLRNKIQLYSTTTEILEENCALITAQVEAGTLLVTELNNELSNLWNEYLKLWQAQYDLIKTSIDK